MLPTTEQYMTAAQSIFKAAINEHGKWPNFKGGQGGTHHNVTQTTCERLFRWRPGDRALHLDELTIILNWAVHKILFMPDELHGTDLDVDMHQKNAFKKEAADFAENRRISSASRRSAKWRWIDRMSPGETVTKLISEGYTPQQVQQQIRVVRARSMGLLDFRWKKVDGGIEVTRL